MTDSGEVKNNNASIDLEKERRGIEERSKEIEKKLGGERELSKGFNTLLIVIAVAMSIFHIYTAKFGMFTALRQRAIHLGFAMAIAFIQIPSQKKKKEINVPWYDYIFAAFSIASCVYMAIYADKILERAGIVTLADQILGVALFIAILEATRRAIGPVLSGIGLFALIYCRFGYIFPGVFWHPGFNIKMILRHMYLTDQGVWATPLGVSSSYISVFLLLGAALHKTGLADLLLKIARGVFGGMVGGPAKMAVISSSMFATISGSSTSNVATTGIVTIPLMKRTGVSAALAGAIEAASSMGGQITPPVMGAVAFIIAEFLGISYLKVALAAALPALLYYVAVFTVVHFESAKLGFMGLPKSEIPPWKGDFFKKWYYFLPVVWLVYLLLRGYSPMIAALYPFFLAIVIALISNRGKDRVKIGDIVEILSSAAFIMTVVALPSAVAGFVEGTASLTGLTPALAAFVHNIAHGKLLPTLVITMCMSLILGMGVPTVANYILMSIMTIPVLVKAGVMPLAAHLFCFHFGIMSELTPPVAITSYTASAIANAEFWPTAFNAVRLAGVAYIVPYFFVFNPELLLGTHDLTIGLAWSIILAIAGAIAFGVAMAGYFLRRMSAVERIIFAIGAVCLIDPTFRTDIIGFVILGLSILFQLFMIKKSKETKGTAAA